MPQSENSTDRYTAWVNASHSLGRIEPFMVVAAQGLGKLDCQLLEADSTFLALDQQQRESIPASLTLSENLTLSYLWVLGAYELVRSISERLKGEPSESLFQDIKRALSRIRMPLAKFQPERRHARTDSHIAFPTVHRELGTAWQVGPDRFMVRRELSDLLLNTLQEYKGANP